jgi:hypothetical protein
LHDYTHDDVDLHNYNHRHDRNDGHNDDRYNDDRYDDDHPVERRHDLQRRDLLHADATFVHSDPNRRREQRLPAIGGNLEPPTR